MDILRPKIDRVSLADFEEMLADRPEDEKWELIDGRVYKSMVGAVWEHHVVIDNIGLAISNHLRARSMPCRVFRENFYLKKAFDDLAALPDVMVRCGPMKPGQTSVEDPVILFEVVSKGSQARDRMNKRVAYQRLPSLQHYILVERDSVLIDHYIRRDDGWHGEPPLDTVSATLSLAAIEFTLPVAEIYRDINSA
ncbi:MAG: Uma2 family endonuclease [Hyphomicrobiaceae bacterium]